MMLLALGANIGGRGDIGFTAVAAAVEELVPLANMDWFINAVRAVAPSPRPACLKKCRRVTARRTSSGKAKFIFFILSLSTYGLRPLNFEFDLLCSTAL